MHVPLKLYGWPTYNIISLNGPILATIVIYTHCRQYGVDIVFFFITRYLFNKSICTANLCCLHSWLKYLAHIKYKYWPFMSLSVKYYTAKELQTCICTWIFISSILIHSWKYIKKSIYTNSLCTIFYLLSCPLNNVYWYNTCWKQTYFGTIYAN